VFLATIWLAELVETLSDVSSTPEWEAGYQGPSDWVGDLVNVGLSGGATSRKALYRRVKHLYSLRSGLSHGGKSAVLGSELIQIEEISWYLLNKMSGKLEEFKTGESLREWIEDLKF